MSRVPFNIPPLGGREFDYLQEVFGTRGFSGNGTFTGRCQAWLKHRLGVADALLTQSCTSALEMAAILAHLEPGDEVIMPSYTFVSTANAVVLRNATPVFVDIRPDTLNIDETLIEAAITPRTRAIFVVHYAGVCAEMDPILALARRHGLMVVEDAAQALLSTYRGRPAGALGDLGCFSFHETKNVTSGEGGALAVVDPDLAERAFVIWEKGTNRRAFKLGQVDKYTWMDCGSSFLPSEITAAVLLAQLEEVERFNSERRVVWTHYHQAFAGLEAAGLARRPFVPQHCEHNAHMYYLILRDRTARDGLIETLRERDIGAPFHYIPLHSSPAGLRYGRTEGQLPVTDRTSSGLLRLPLFAGMAIDAADRVIEAVHTGLRHAVA
ncbi:MULTISPECIES: dTDP-4-amino-4,6-dideoxygalactose transaminase [unclassified Aureimonas]|uniref:dTDP-4-amino-4,6-dideoxygalactose transaminase n=1 Tax=unclassified Aureimonas TaxID=2615206 RepID=UPI0006F496A9|nr:MULTISPECIES: dTDP-4-amino-4,6-dideoxygalactose transaminase [unclassified Aureimonas]KQT58710.1 TDP-4-oxo-6-deoxy-D-glucose aminotransferase [Aureimonas sp. Leaf427]KQT63954.1 TDP-4-oxo-6-deoxy-D-glucose aminotransferase [Aureimonas sp. Leaf460]